jgi:hypothetical protein
VRCCSSVLAPMSVCVGAAGVDLQHVHPVGRVWPGILEGDGTPRSKGHDTLARHRSCGSDFRCEHCNCGIYDAEPRVQGSDGSLLGFGLP